MESRRYFFATACLLALIYFTPVLGLQCHRCYGVTGYNSNCESNATAVMKENCTQDFICAVYITVSNNISTIQRGCYESNICEIINAKNPSTHFPSGNRSVTLCKTCDSDLCNANPLSSRVNIIALISCILIVFVFSKM